MKPSNKIVIITLALCFFMFNMSSATLVPSRLKILKRYMIKDTSKVIKHGTLILYTNNTFINFGICSGKKESESYIWYSVGTWTSNDTSLVVKLDNDLFDEEQLKKDIKSKFKKRSIYGSTNSNYEFVKEYFTERSFEQINSELLDRNKSIIYNEVNS